MTIPFLPLRFACSEISGFLRFFRAQSHSLLPGLLTLLLAAATCLSTAGQVQAAQTADSPAESGTLPGSSLSVDSIVTRAAQGLATTSSLETTFVQEKRIPLLELPLMAEGRLCFQVSAPSSAYIFWEYHSPSQSGFQYEKDAIRLWSGTSSRDIPAAEQDFLRGMVNQILQWIRFDKKALEKQYSLSLVGGNDYALALTPRTSSPVFARIELHFSTDFTRISSILMTGPQKDVTILTFRPGLRNRPLSADCRR